MRLIASSGYTRTRVWTDEQLRTAVAQQRSWRAVARALGLQVSTTNNLRRHAVRLRLDTSHFTGRRAWSDQQLRDAVRQASSWGDVLARLNVSDNAGARTRAKGHAVRLELDCSHLQPCPPDGRDAGEDLAHPRRQMLRRAATAIAVACCSLPCQRVSSGCRSRAPRGATGTAGGWSRSVAGRIHSTSRPAGHRTTRTPSTISSSSMAPVGSISSPAASSPAAWRSAQERMRVIA
jgi:hypothetical protein